MGKRGESITYTLDAPAVHALCAADVRLSILIKHYGQLNYILHTDGTSFIIETIVGQMLSNKVADAITARLYDLCGGKLTTDRILKLDIPSLKGIGLSGKKSEYILGIAKLLHNTPDYFMQLTDMPDDEIIQYLTSLRGIGTWTAKMYLIFVLDRKDILPFEDGAFLQAYKWLFATDDIKPESIKKQCMSWHPFSSIAARYLYRALDEGLTRDVGLSERLLIADR